MSGSAATSRRRSAIDVSGFGIVSAAGRGGDATAAALRASRDGLGPLTRFESPRCGGFPVAEVSGTTDALSVARPALADAIAQAGVDPVRDGRAFDPSVWLRHECGALADALAAEAGLGGPRATLSTACSSGAEAIAFAAALIERGAADVMIAGGADALCRLTLNGFASLLAVDPEGCRPFDRDRAGMSLGEGAAFVVLERSSARPLARLAGWANSCDAHHATAPHPDGRGAEAALRAAIRAAGLAPGDIDYVNAHGTGTTENDRAEGRALHRLFGERAPPVSSTKRLFGHALGAAGAIEAVACIVALREGILPGTPGLATADPECSITPLGASRAAELRTALTSSFGFGGNNTVLCLVR